MRLPGFRLSKSLHYSTHLPLLIEVVTHTRGDVLEMGTGIFSTPVLHWLCSPNKRSLVSYESDPHYYETFKQFEDEYHRVIHIPDWDAAEIEQPWDVAFIDHSPMARRKVDVARLANHARYIVIHDSDWRSEKYYQWKEIYPLFSAVYEHKKTIKPRASVLSNFDDLGWLKC